MRIVPNRMIATKGVGKLQHDPSERIRQFDLRLQRTNPPLGFPGGQVVLEQFWLIGLGAEAAQGRELPWRHRGVGLIGETGHRELQKILWLDGNLNLKFVLILFFIEVIPARPANGQQT